MPADVVLDEAAGLRTACVALDRSATSLATSCEETRNTVAALDAALGGISHAGGAPGDYGVIGLPVQAAIKAARGVATQLVRQRTGTSLDEWTVIIARTVEAFDDYVQRLATTSTTLRAAGSNGTVAPGDLAESLQGLESATRAWKPVLVTLGQLGGVVEAVRTGITASTSEESEPGEDPDQAPQAKTDAMASFRSAATRARGAVTDVVSTVTAKPNPWQDILLAPFVDIAERVQALPGTLQAVTVEVQTLELLVDVAQAQVAVALGKASAEEAQLVAVRAHVLIDIPELSSDIEMARREVDGATSAIDRLARAVEAGQVDSTTAATLDAEYRGSLADARARAEQLETTLAAWRQHSRTMLDTCIEAATAQLRTFEARAIAEDTDRYAHRCQLLRHELAVADQIADRIHDT